jgi:hypothetical protein
MPTFQSSWDASQAGGPATGAFTYDSGVDGLTFGSGAPPAPKVLAFTGLDDGSSYAVRFEFSGADTSKFKATVVTKNAVVDPLATPHFASSGSLTVGVTEPGGGATWSVTFDTINTFGVEATMTVEIYDAGSGLLIDTITATATNTLDVFVVEALTNASCLGVWGSIQAATTPPYYVNGNSVYQDFSGKGEDDLELVGAAVPNDEFKWAYSTDSPGTEGVCASSVFREFGASGYLGIISVLAATKRSGMILFRIANWTSADVAVYGDSGLTVGLGTDGRISVGRDGGQRYVQMPTPRISITEVTTWQCVAWRKPSADGAPVVYVSKIGGTGVWKDQGSATMATAYNDTDGMQAQSAGTTGGTPTAYTSVIATFSADILEAGLEALYDSIPL